MLKAIEAILTSDIMESTRQMMEHLSVWYLELTEDRRKELAKDVRKGEEAKVAVRNVRH